MYGIKSCDATSGFRCTSFAAVNADDVRVDDDDVDISNSVRCTCMKDNGTGCHSVVMTTDNAVKPLDNSSHVTAQTNRNKPTASDKRIQMVEGSEHLLDPVAEGEANIHNGRWQFVKV